MDTLNNQLILLSAQRALLFNIIPSVRFIFVEIEEGDKLKLLIYFDAFPDEDVKDIYYSVAGEIGGDFPTIDDSKTEVIFKVAKVDFREVGKLKHLVYARCE